MKREKFCNLRFALCILNKAGFSLVELALVLLLLALSSLLVLPAVDRAFEKQAVRRATVKLAATARDLRSRAIYEGILQGLLINASESSYQTPLGRKVFLSPAARISEVVGGEVFGEGERRFVFFPNGSILGGEIVVSGLKGSSFYRIRFNPLSGRIVVHSRSDSDVTEFRS